MVVIYSYIYSTHFCIYSCNKPATVYSKTFGDQCTHNVICTMEVFWVNTVFTWLNAAVFIRIVQIINVANMYICACALI